MRVGEALAGLALGIVVGVGVAAAVHRCDVPVMPTPPASSPAPAADDRFEACAAANMSMATALEALAYREDGCAKFLDLGVSDPWIKCRLDHPRPGSGLSSRDSSPGSARSPASPASAGKPGSTTTSPSGRLDR